MSQCIVWAQTIFEGTGGNMQQKTKRNEPWVSNVSTYALNNTLVKFLTQILLNVFRNKEKINRTIRKINIMKKLIVNFIAASNHMLYKDPFFVKMLEEHRELVNIETVLKMCQSNFESKENKSS